MTLRRRFRTDGRRLLDIADEALDGTIVDGAAVGDFLLEELERRRDVHMRDIVATIQADQYRLITHDPGTPLVIQGGPGTGKTAVGLHRASWLLYTQRDQLRHRGVLVIGPNRTFMEYVSHVLPALGEDAVEQRAVGELVDGASRSAAIRRRSRELKADLRLVDVIARAAELRLESAPEELVLRLEGSFISVRASEVRELLAAARSELGTTVAARERFRMSLLRRSTRIRPRARRGRDPQLRGGRTGAARKWLSRPCAEGCLARRVAGQARAVADRVAHVARRRRRRDPVRGGAEAARRGAEPAGRTATFRCSTRRARWSAQPPRTYGHVIVDEAQDLTPMQLRMVARRAGRAR